MKALKIGYHRLNKFKEAGLVFKKKKYGPPGSKRYNLMISITDLLNWLESHQAMFKALPIERYALGIEPGWLSDKRKKEFDIEMRKCE